MALSISPTQSDIFTALRDFLISILPPNTDVVKAVQNRVPEPTHPNFIIMSSTRFSRISTNYDGYSDSRFTGSVAPGTASFTGEIEPAEAEPSLPPSGVLRVTAISAGEIVVGGLLSGGTVKSGTRVLYQIDGSPGGVGTYAVNISQTTASATLAETYGLLTVTAVQIGQVPTGTLLFGEDVATGSVIYARGTGTGGAGTYIVQPSQTVNSETLSAGTKSMTQAAIVVIQLDFHSVNDMASDMAQTVSTAFRDEFGTSFFSALEAPLNGIAPLYADDPRYMPFQNENLQWEWRWVLEVRLQVNQVVSVPQQFADVVEVDLINVDATYPPDGPFP